MAILGAVSGVLGRFVGKLLTAALGWASTLLFGRVPQDKQIVLVPSFVDQEWVRLAMLVGGRSVPGSVCCITEGPPGVRARRVPGRRE